MKEFDGRVAVVTGAASGIGAALAREAAARGMRIVAADIERPALDAICGELSAAGAEVIGIVGDVSDRAQVDALAESTVERFGAVHLVFNNAGVSAGGASWEIEPDVWEWVLGVDLLGVVWGVRAFVPRIIESGGGHVVNTASMAGLTSPPFMAPYNVAKHGVVSLSESLAQELAMSGAPVGVTVLCPGWVRTKINRSERNRPDHVEADDGEPNPLREYVQGLIDGGLDPDEVAATTFAAVEEGTFAVLTHADWAAGVETRGRLLAEGRLMASALPEL